VLQETISGVDNDNLSTQAIDDARLGAVNGIDATTSGTTYFDAFESRRSSYIGPLAYLAPNYALANEDQAKAKHVVVGSLVLTFGIIFL
jgi:hypothetical protein